MILTAVQQTKKKKQQQKTLKTSLRKGLKDMIPHMFLEHLLPQSVTFGFCPKH